MKTSDLLDKAIEFNKVLSDLYQELFYLDKQLANELNIYGGKIFSSVNNAVASQSMRDFIQNISSAYSSANKTLQILQTLRNLHSIEKQKLSETVDLCYELIRLLSTFMSSTHIRKIK